MSNRLGRLVLAGGTTIVDVLGELFESRAKALALLSALLIGVVLGVALAGDDVVEACQTTPRWLLVDVGSTLVVSNPDDESVAGGILDRILGRQRQPERGELGLRMVDTCRIGEIRGGTSDGREYSVIDMLAGPNVDSHELTVFNRIAEICAVLDCGDATARRPAKAADEGEQRATFGDRREESKQQTDRDALVALYRVTGGARWTDDEHWQTAAPMGEWYGVSSLPGAAGNVTALQLRGNNLTGEIPAELGNLPRLITLVLANNNLNGPIPAELGDLVDLKVLDLLSNDLTGAIPPELGKLGNLEALVLGGNNLGGAIPVELGNLTKLVNLHLDTDTGLCLAEGFPAKSQFGTMARAGGIVGC